MQPPADHVHPGPRREGSVALRWACLVLVPCWAVAGAVLGVMVFRAWMQPLPNPVTGGPIPSDGWLVTVIKAFLMAVPLVGMSVALVVSGLEYLRSAMLTGRWRTAWACAVTAAVTPDLTPQIRAGFAGSGFDEVAFDVLGTSALTGIGVHRLSRAPAARPPTQPLFTFSAV